MALAGARELAGHVADENGGVVFAEPLDGVEEAVLANERALLVAGVADALDDAEEVETGEWFVGGELLEDAGEEFGLGEAEGDGWTQSE